MKNTFFSLQQRFFVIFFFLFNTLLPAQDDFYQRDSSRLFKELYPKIDRLLGKNLDSVILCLKIVQSIGERHDSLYDAALYSYFMLAERMTSLDEELAWLQKADSFIVVKLRQKIPLRADYLTRVMYDWGRYYYKLGNFDEALAKFQQFTESDKEGGTNRYLATSFIGYINFTKGDYPKAISYFEDSKRYIPTTDPFSAFHYNFMFGHAFLELEETQLADRYLQEAKRLGEKLPDKEPRKRTYLARTSIALSQNLRFQCRLKEAEKNIASAERVLSGDHTYQPDLYLEWSKILILDERPEEALSKLRTGLDACNLLYKDSKHYKRGVLLTEMGNAYSSEGQFVQALSAIQLAITEFVPDFTSLDLSSNPNREHLRDCHAHKELLNALHLKANLLHRLSAVEGGNASRLVQSLEAYQQAIAVIQLLRNDFRTDSSKHLLADLRFEIFEEAIGVAHSLYISSGEVPYANAAFSFAEKSKAASLFESLTADKALQIAGVSNEMLERERTLTQTVAYYERKLREAHDNNRAEMVETNRRELHTATERYGQFIDTLEKKFPKYYNLKYELDPVSWSDVAPDLERLNATAIEYFWGDYNVFAFQMTKNGIRMRHLDIDPNNTAIDEFQQSCMEMQPTIPALQNLAQQAQQLYRILVAPLQTDDERLVIVPDGKLCRIPFGNLVNADTLTGNFAPFFLENQKIISYAVSLTVWKENLKATPVKGPDYLAFAPVRFKKYNLSELLLTDPHLDNLSKWMSGKSLRGQEADLQHFDEETRPGKFCNMLLLYTHAVAENNPRIFFYDETLHLSDLYARRIHANFTVLSTCESGTGNYQRGEGVMSLGRGFAYAGVPAVATTLWPVQEAPTLEILEDFYANLSQGMPKDEALAGAKRQYLLKNARAIFQPQLWSGLILMGNPDPLFEKPENSGAIFWMLAVVFAALGILLIWRYYRKNQGRYISST